MNLRDAFRTHLEETTSRTSHKVTSYLRALDMLGEILGQSSSAFSHIIDLWGAEDPEEIDKLYHFVLEQQKGGSLFTTNHAKSYWRDGFYSAALGGYRRFLIEHFHTERLDAIYEEQGDDHDPQAFDVPLQHEDILSKTEGREVLREVKTRANQSVFSRRVKKNYDFTCCVTGIDVPDLVEAAHIIPWSDNKKTGLDPHNGLCLSATFHLAFDRHLIGFDDTCQLVISDRLQDHFSTDAVRDYFEPRAGQTMILPHAAQPQPALLKQHLKLLC